MIDLESPNKHVRVGDVAVFDASYGRRRPKEWRLCEVLEILHGEVLVKIIDEDDEGGEERIATKELGILLNGVAFESMREARERTPSDPRWLLRRGEGEVGDDLVRPINNYDYWIVTADHRWVDAPPIREARRKYDIVDASEWFDLSR
jgi:hypothetical protein